MLTFPGRPNWFPWCIRCYPLSPTSLSPKQFLGSGFCFLYNSSQASHKSATVAGQAIWHVWSWALSSGSPGQCASGDQAHLVPRVHILLQVQIDGMRRCTRWHLGFGLGSQCGGGHRRTSHLELFQMQLHKSQ